MGPADTLQFLPNPIGRTAKTYFRSINALIAFLCSSFKIKALSMSSKTSLSTHISALQRHPCWLKTNSTQTLFGDVVDYVTVDHLSIIIGGTVAQLLALLALPPQSKKVMGSIPALGAVDSWGEVLPRLHSAQMVYLPGLSVWSLHVLPVFTRGFLHKDGQFTSLGPRALQAQAYLCVCPVSPPYMHVCVPVCRVCH